MKKLLGIFIIIFVFNSTSFSQNKMTEFNAGFLAPKDAETGFFGGLNLGRMVDERIGVSLGIHVYHSSYTKEATVSTGQTGQTQSKTKITKLKQSATLIPLFFQLHYTGPITQSLDLKVTAGIGYEFLWNSYTNFEDHIDDSDFFNGFGWMVSSGISIPISSASDFYGEVLYHGGTPSKNQGKNEQGFPVRTEVDMSGLGIRIGLRLYSFGI